MDFQKLLLDVGKALSQEEVKALAFLCTDLLGLKLTSVGLASDLFSRMVEQDLLSVEQPHLLTELLLIIQRTRLIRDLRLTESTTRNLISSYRKLLYNLSEDITDANLKDIKFLLKGQLPRRQLEDNVTTLEVFLEMEHKDLINDTNLNLLEELLQSCCPVLNEEINRYKEQQASPHSSHIAQETGRPRSISCPPEPNQNQCLPFSHPERCRSTDFSDPPPLPESTMSPSNTSVDFQNRPDVVDLSLSLSRLSTTRSSSPSSNVGSDASVISPSQLNENSSQQQTAQTTNTNTEDLGSYPMTAAKRGLCLIINNNNFSESKQRLQTREGTMVDEERLNKVFEWLGFHVVIERDCDRKRMLRVVKNHGEEDHCDVDCLVCCVLSHGEQDGVYGVDGLTVALNELKEPFNGLKCPSLTEKPKLFFIQACQGVSRQEPVYIQSDGLESSSIPSEADFLLAMATVPSYVSFRERSNGTWFIQALCQNLIQMVPKGLDLMSILTKVNADVSRKTDNTGQKKQMPQPAFTLRKKVVFPVPKAPPPSLTSLINSHNK
ncbi:caspase-8 [Labrus mixtus]|uniref:caspase-8 n=1 Tax=Labrus mixtus TaxID=508554 RepID=UPI0029C00856|nr:caspase-8 [Labrus mixtus]